MGKDAVIQAARLAALSRRGLLQLSATVAGGAILGLGRAGLGRAAEVQANLGHFGSANPQTYAKATKAYEELFGPRVGVRWVQVNSGGQVIQFMAGGSVDVCNAGSSPMVVGFVNGAPVSMVYVEKYITDSEALVVRTDRGIGSVKDLKGKTIATPFNSSAHFALLVAMQKLGGLSAGDARLINTPPDQLAAAWRQGAIDAAYIWQPVIANLTDDKGKVLLESADLIPYGVIIFDGILVRDEFKRKHPDLVLTYLKEYDRIAQLYVDRPKDVAKLMSDFLQLPIDKARAYVDGFHPLSPKEMIDKKWMGRGNAADTGVNKALLLQAEFLKDQGAIPRAPESFAQYIDTSFLEKMV